MISDDSVQHVQKYSPIFRSNPLILTKCVFSLPLTCKHRQIGSKNDDKNYKIQIQKFDKCS